MLISSSESWLLQYLVESVHHHPSNVPSQCSRWYSQAPAQVWERSQTPQPFETALVVEWVWQGQRITSSSPGLPRWTAPLGIAGTWNSPQETWASRIARRASRQLRLQCRHHPRQGRWFRWCCCDGNRCRWHRPPNGCCRRRDCCCCCGQWSTAYKAPAGNNSSSSSSCGAIYVASSSGGNHFSKEDGPYRWFKVPLEQSKAHALINSSRKKMVKSKAKVRQKSIFVFLIVFFFCWTWRTLRQRRNVILKKRCNFMRTDSNNSKHEGRGISNYLQWRATVWMRAQHLGIKSGMTWRELWQLLQDAWKNLPANLLWDTDTWENCHHFSS